MGMHRILVSGSIAYDRIMNFPGTFKEHFQADKMHVLSVSFVVDSLDESFGGTAGNIAYNLSLLNETPVVMSSVGHDFKKYRDRFDELKIDTTSIQVSELIPTAVAHIITDESDNQISAFYPGALAESFANDIPQAELAIIAPGNAKDMQLLPAKLRAASIPFFFDPGQQTTVLSPEAFRDALPGAVALLGNDYEIAMILKKLEIDMKGLLELVPAVVTTLGAEGSRITTREGETLVQGVKALQVLDPTGAGDAYRAGFAYAWLRKLPLAACAQVASAVAVYTVESYGTQTHHFEMKDIAKRYEDTYGTAFPQ